MSHSEFQSNSKKTSQGRLKLIKTKPPAEVFLCQIPCHPQCFQTVFKPLYSLYGDGLMPGKRLIWTFPLTVGAIVTLRHTRWGQLLSELGAYFLTANKAPARTRRLSNLLCSPELTNSLIGTFYGSRLMNGCEYFNLLRHAVQWAETARHDGAFLLR